MQIGAGAVRKLAIKRVITVSPKGRFRAVVYVVIALNTIKRMFLLHEKSITLLSQIPYDAASKRSLVAPRVFVAESVAYELTTLQRIFVTFDRPTASLLSRIIFAVIVLAILVSIAFFVLSGTPQYNVTPSTCDYPTCDHDPTLCPTSTICEPVYPSYYDQIDMACVIIFTVDYIIRLLTCWCVPPPLAGVTTDNTSEMGSVEQVIRYSTKLTNLIDIASILPFYVELGVSASRGSKSSSSSFVRILRLARLLRVLKVGKGSEITTVLFTSMDKAAPAMLIALFFVFMGTIAFASIFHIVEQGEFMVTSQYPDGEYLRMNKTDTGYERSPFTSIPISIYFTIITQTTVGYGDLYPTSIGGRALASFLAHIGILVLALPISVVGSNFSLEYDKYAQRKLLESRGCIVDDAVVAYEDVLRDNQAVKLVERKMESIRNNRSTSNAAADDGISLSSSSSPIPVRRTHFLLSWSSSSEDYAGNLIVNGSPGRRGYSPPPPPPQQHTFDLELILAKMNVAIGRRKVLRRDLEQQNGIKTAPTTEMPLSQAAKFDVVLAKLRVALARRKAGKRSRFLSESGRNLNPLLISTSDPNKAKQWVAPREYRFVELYIERVYHLSWIGRVFVTLHDDDSSRLGAIITPFMIGVIFLNVICFVLSSIPGNKYQTSPSSCAHPACHNDPVLCPGYMICAPEPLYSLTIIDKACVIIFTIEFGLRLLTCWAVPARVAHVLDSEWDDNEAVNAALEHCSARPDPPPSSWYYQIISYLLLWNSFIDILSIVPYYVHLSGATSTSLSFLRVLRLARLLRFLKFMKGGEYTHVLVNTLKRSTPALCLMSFIVLLVLVFYGAVMYSCEVGIFQAVYLSGTNQSRYMRPTVLGDTEAVSPYMSIPAGIYWAAVTVTTLGYGDLYPTSEAGRSLACFAMYMGVLCLAMPIGVISGNFLTEYDSMLEIQKLREQSANGELAARNSRRKSLPKATRASISGGCGGGRNSIAEARELDDKKGSDPYELIQEFLRYQQANKKEEEEEIAAAAGGEGSGRWRGVTVVVGEGCRGGGEDRGGSEVTEAAAGGGRGGRELLEPSK